MPDEDRRRHGYVKSWSPVFGAEPRCEEETPYVEQPIWIESQAVEFGDLLGFVLQYSEELGPDWHVEEVKKFCQGAWLKDFESEVRTQPLRRAAWLDDRRTFHGTNAGDFRAYENPLSAASLYRHLKQPVSDSDHIAS